METAKEKMKNPFSIVKDFEDAVAEYCGAPDCIALDSCTNALFLCLEYFKYLYQGSLQGVEPGLTDTIQIPKFTYLSVPSQIKNAGFKVSFRDEDWTGAYELYPFALFDSARRFTSNMYSDFNSQKYMPFVCTSHHWSKQLGIQQGGCILFNGQGYSSAREWFERARFDGRKPGLAPKDDNPTWPNWHMYLSPEIAAEGLVRLHHLPKHNADLKNDDYPDLSKMEIFK